MSLLSFILKCNELIFLCKDPTHLCRIFRFHCCDTTKQEMIYINTHQDDCLEEWICFSHFINEQFEERARWIREESTDFNLPLSSSPNNIFIPQEDVEDPASSDNKPLSQEEVSKDPGNDFIYGEEFHHY